MVDAVDVVREAARPLTGAASDYDPLVELIGDSRFVLLGEASHGTHEFYRERAQITKRLIKEKGFTAVAVEADWPDAYRVNRYVRGRGYDNSSGDALSGFKRFPQWMWRNADVLDFTGWLRAHNDALSANSRVGFYGLDLLFDEFAAAVLGTVDEFAERVRMIGQDPVASPQEMLATASVKVAGRGQTMREMIREADENLLIVIKEMRAGARVADEADDPGTVDLFSRFVQIHEKHEWWLRDMLEKRDGLTA